MRDCDADECFGYCLHRPVFLRLARQCAAQALALNLGSVISWPKEIT